MSTQFVIEIGWRHYAVPSEKIDSVLKTLQSLREVKVNVNYSGYHYISDTKPAVSECRLAAVTDTDPTPPKEKPESEEEEGA